MGIKYNTTLIKEKLIHQLVINELNKIPNIGRIAHEFKTPVGYIDILLEDEVIEVKEVSKFKHGIGQLIAYNKYVKRPKMTLYLFGYNNTLKRSVVSSTCKDAGVGVRFIHVNISIETLVDSPTINTNNKDTSNEDNELSVITPSHNKDLDLDSIVF